MHRSFPQQPHHRCQPPQRLAQRSIEFAVFPVRCAAARQLLITDLVHLPGPRRLLTHPSMRTWSFTGLPTGRHPSSAVRLSAASNPLSLPRHRAHVKSEVEEKLSKTFENFLGMVRIGGTHRPGFLPDRIIFQSTPARARGSPTPWRGWIGI